MLPAAHLAVGAVLIAQSLVDGTRTTWDLVTRSGGGDASAAARALENAAQSPRLAPRGPPHVPLVLTENLHQNCNTTPTTSRRPRRRRARAPRSGRSQALPTRRMGDSNPRGCYPNTLSKRAP